MNQPYIDEHFHLRMTQKYIVEHNFTYWDEKITTPPGLYIFGYLFAILFKKFEFLTFKDEQITKLRHLNR